MILVTNDDGVYSPGIIQLYKALSTITDTRVVAPRGAQSSSGMSITFHRPVRLHDVNMRNYRATAVGGTPADCVFLSVHKLFGRKNIQMVASGINMGENISMQSFFSSGTVSAAMSGSIIGIKSIAFSKEVEAEEDKPLTEAEFRSAARWAARIVRYILENGFPGDVDLLNVNFPMKTTDRTRVSITRMASEMFDDYVVERRDPRGNKYLWLAGQKKHRGEEGTDLHSVLVRNQISITPISVKSIQAAYSDSSYMQNFLSALNSRRNRVTH